MIITVLGTLVLLKLFGLTTLGWLAILSIPFLYVGTYLTIVVISIILLDVTGKNKGDK